jgi:cell shape-determining protein MreD
VIFYIVLPFLSLLLIVIQTMIADIFFFGKIGVELSLILVIYAGFRLDIMKGGILSFILGFFRDCINCSISGPYTFLYVLVFLISMLASDRISPGKSSFIMIFTLMCASFEIIVIFLFHLLLYGGDISILSLKAYIPQTLILSGLSPILFSTISRIDVLLSGKDARTVKRA